jgi:hypothetical protein
VRVRGASQSAKRVEQRQRVLMYNSMSVAGVSIYHYFYLAVSLPPLSRPAPAPSPRSPLRPRVRVGCLRPLTLSLNSHQAQQASVRDTAALRRPLPRVPSSAPPVPYNHLSVTHTVPGPCAERRAHAQPLVCWSEWGFGAAAVGTSRSSTPYPPVSRFRWFALVSSPLFCLQLYSPGPKLVLPVRTRSNAAVENRDFL